MILDRLLHHLVSDTVETEEDAATREAKEKRARIEWHRRNVRNGPTKMGSISEGRAKSRQRRQMAAAERKMNLRHRRTWMKNQHRRAILRGQLQFVGMVPLTSGYVPTPEQSAAAKVWIEERFESVQAAYQAYVGKR